MNKTAQTTQKWGGCKLVALLAMTMAFAANGAEWYVDAANGDDGWDGTTAEIPVSGTVARARR